MCKLTDVRAYHRACRPFQPVHAIFVKCIIPIIEPFQIISSTVEQLQSPPVAPGSIGAQMSVGPLQIQFAMRHYIALYAVAPNFNNGEAGRIQGTKDTRTQPQGGPEVWSEAEPGRPLIIQGPRAERH